MHRRYLLLPLVPEGLKDPVVRQIDVLLGPSLAPLSEEEEAEEASFRVIYMPRCKTKAVALIFSSRLQHRTMARGCISELE